MERFTVQVTSRRYTYESAIRVADSGSLGRSDIATLSSMVSNCAEKRELSCFLCNMMCRLGTPVVGPGPGRRGGADPGGGGAAAGAIIMIARRAPGRAVKPSESSGPPGPNRDSVRRTSRISDYRPGPAREPPPARAGPPGPTEISLRVRVTAHVLSQDESLAPT